MTKPDNAPGQGFLGKWCSYSNSLALGFFTVLPVWLLYEIARYVIGPRFIRNGAEVFIDYVFGSMGVYGFLFMRISMGVAIIWSCFLLIKRDLPVFKLASLVVLEGLVWGSLIGPLGILISVNLSGFWPLEFFSAIGAGIYEEVLFRLFFLSLLFFVLKRTFSIHSIHPFFAMAGAVFMSSVFFSLAHHLNGGSIEPGVFVFRLVVGALLGIIFLFRGFGVAVYSHIWYDILYFLFS